MPQLDVAAAGRKIAADAMRPLKNGEHADDVLCAFDHHVIGDARPQLRFPVRDPVELKRLLKVAIGDLSDLLVSLDRLPNNDRSALLLGRSGIQALNHKLNAKRRL